MDVDEGAALQDSWRTNRAKMAQAARWAHRIFPLLILLFGHQAVSSGALIQAKTMSTMFSGMLSAEVSVDFLRSGAASSGIQMDLRPVLAIDTNLIAQVFLQQQGYHTADQFLFMSDVVHLFDCPFLE